MASFCTKCGADLAEGNAFCTKCGARRDASTAAAAAQQFCTKCGAAFAAETKFCTKCGATVDILATTTPRRSSAASSSGGAAGSPSPAAASRTPTAESRAAIPKLALIASGIVVLALVIAVVAGMIGAARRARQKAQELETAQKFEKSLAKLAYGRNAPEKNVNRPSPVDINKRINDLAAAANALTQNTQRQGGANTVNGTAGIAGSAPSNSGASDANEAPAPPPMVPVAATGNQVHDWALKYERTVGGPEADLVVRTGDINNLGFGWPKGFDPFSGQSTPVHRWPWPAFGNPPRGEPDGTDRIMIGSGVFPGLLAKMGDSNIKEDLAAGQILLGPPDPTLNPDGYSGGFVNSCHASQQNFTYVNAAEVRARDAADCVRLRRLTMPQPIVLDAGELPSKIHDVVLQIFADDFQAPSMHSHFQVSLNGTRIPNFESAINSIDQSGPIGKLLTFELLPEYWPLLKSGTVKLLIDDPTTHMGDGYAVDFVRILVNPHKFKYEVSFTATVTDADTHKPITGATVNAGLTSAATNRQGKCELKGLPAGLVVATANAPGYDENSVPVDLPAGQSGNADIQLHRHQESTAALEQAIAQTGTATIYGIHFDTDSSKIRGDSIPALNAVLGLIHNHPGAHWIIAGHTDNQGNAAHNQTLSESRSKSVIAWLKQHGGDVSNLVPQGFGATRPVADNATVSGRALNRRVEVSLAK